MKCIEKDFIVEDNYKSRNLFYEKFGFRLKNENIGIIHQPLNNKTFPLIEIKKITENNVYSIIYDYNNLTYSPLIN